MDLLRIDASIRTTGSASRDLGDLVQRHWQEQHPGGSVATRDLGTQPLPASAWGHAIAAGATEEADRTTDQRDAVALAGALVDELITADAVLIDVPLYNFGVSQHLKTWIDLVISDPRAGNAAAPLLQGKPVVLVTVRGGAYGPGTPREGWDHSTNYLKQILADVWGADVRVVEREFTLVGVNPALDAFTDTAAQMKTEAHRSAQEAGTELADVVDQMSA